MWHAYGNANVKPNSNLNSYGNINTNSDPHGCGYSYTYSCWHSDTYADVCGRQPIYDKPDWRQHCAGHDRHRQSRG